MSFGQNVLHIKCPGEVVLSLMVLRKNVLLVKNVFSVKNVPEKWFSGKISF